MRKQRLDTLLAERGLFPSRTRAAASVMAGEVCVGPERRRAQKPGELVAPDATVSVAERARFVSRGGIKLANALAGTGVAVTGRRVLDVGASTGGFTDCLLQHGAAEVLAIDVGYGELAYALRTDPRVRTLERTNARGLTPEIVIRAFAKVNADPITADEHDGPAPQASPRAAPADLAVIDVSFISLCKVLPAVLDCLADSCEVLALVKPQFEVGRGRVGRGGVVRDPADRRSALIAVGLAACELGTAVRGFCSSGLPGPKGNRETFVWLARESATEMRGDGASTAVADIERMAREVEP
ncbi:MAG TPA: TlyA family RNA methyltransferase [Solirubrobacteraceae bacterium]|jgi:23S rRNA (cytidine1920-2'-O)/16S rRNA (cytidine1409-2'-O)-methyltransferase